MKFYSIKFENKRRSHMIKVVYEKKSVNCMTEDNQCLPSSVKLLCGKT